MSRVFDIDFEELLLFDLKGNLDIDFKENLDIELEGILDIDSKGNLDLELEGILDIDSKGNLDLELEGILDIDSKGNLDLELEGILDIDSKGNLDIGLEGILDTDLKGNFDSSRQEASTSTWRNSFEFDYEQTNRRTNDLTAQPQKEKDSFIYTRDVLTEEEYIVKMKMISSNLLLPIGSRPATKFGDLFTIQERLRDENQVLENVNSGDSGDSDDYFSIDSENLYLALREEYRPKGTVLRYERSLSFPPIDDLTAQPQKEKDSFIYTRDVLTEEEYNVKMKMISSNLWLPIGSRPATKFGNSFTIQKRLRDENQVLQNVNSGNSGDSDDYFSID